MAEFIRIGTKPHEWSNLVENWKKQTEDLQEEFDEEYQLQPDIFLSLIGRNDPKAGLYAVQDEGNYISICQVNTAGLPGYNQPVTRVRHITFSPLIDLGSDQSVEVYSKALVETFGSVLMLCKNEGPMKSGYLNFHLPSPADRQFFTFAGQKFKEGAFFADVALKGAWLYITL